MMKLLMDVGNRRVKWASCEGGARALGNFGEADCAEGGGEVGARLREEWLGFAETPSAVWGVCVAGMEVRRAVGEATREVWALRPIWLEAEARGGGVVNGYREAGRLGGDRWSALVAAGELFPREAVVVVDVGTAVTVDLLDGEGRFRGGVIFPGLQVMREALVEYTEKIRAGDFGGDFADAAGGAGVAAATDTRAGVANGTLFAVAGGINLTIARHREALAGEALRVVVTGGGGAEVARWLVGEVQVEPRLVLQGLAVLAQQHEEAQQHQETQQYQETQQRRQAGGAR